MKTVDVVCGACIVDGKVLIARRAGGSSAGWFEFPGGKIEPGETGEQALAREWREECGVEIEDIQPLMESSDEQDGMKIRLFSYTCTAKEKPEIPVVHDAFVWTTPEHIYDYHFFESDRALVERLKEAWPSLSRPRNPK